MRAGAILLRGLAWVLAALVALALLGLATLATLGGMRIDPVVWQPGPLPDMRDTDDESLSASRRVLEGVGVGPEDVAPGPDGSFFVGYADGRIVHAFADGRWSVLANTGGRPLGLQRNAGGALIVADALRGLLSVSMDGVVTVLVDQVDGVPLKFVDDLDIAANGTIWFSDASQRFGLEESLYDFLEASASGRLLSYEPASARTEVRLDGLHFANGVALGPGERYVLVNETGAARIRRLWLRGERRGEDDWFATGLPGLPDNLSFNGTDTFWVAMPSPRNLGGEAWADRPWLRRLVAGLPYAWLVPAPSGPPQGFVVGIGLDGAVRERYRDRSGRCYTITSANQVGETLYLGSLVSQAVCAFRLAAH